MASHWQVGVSRAKSVASHGKSVASHGYRSRQGDVSPHPGYVKKSKSAVHGSLTGGIQKRSYGSSGKLIGQAFAVCHPPYIVPGETEREMGVESKRETGVKVGKESVKNDEV